ncbi:MAG: VanW family protein [Desulfotomaculales bacterium]
MPKGPRLIPTVALCVLAVVLGAAAGFWGFVYATAASDRVFPGVYVRDVSLGGLSRDACIERLKALEEELGSRPVEVAYQDSSWSIKLREIGLRLDVERMTALAMRAGREGTFIHQWLARQRISNMGFEVPLLISIDEKLLRHRVSTFGRDLIVAPRDAGFIVHPDDKVEIVPHVEGLDIDIGRIYREIRNELRDGASTLRVPVYLVRVPPRHTTEDVRAMGINGLLASYTTTFDPTLVNRAYNISVAAAALDGLLVAPGHEVSFNEIVGPRSQEAGYKDAPVILNENLVPGLGGGVCQVSSTLYNAVLLANLKVTERANHSLPVAYVPLGRDATVVYGSVDLKFVNTTPSYIYLKAPVRGSRITIKIYGNTLFKRRVEIRTKTVEIFEPKKQYEQDPNLEAGKEVVKQAGQRGYRVEAERWVWNNGAVTREALPASLYKPRDEIVAVGTKAVPTTVTPPSPPPDQATLPKTPPPAAGEGEPPVPPAPEETEEPPAAPADYSREEAPPGSGPLAPQHTGSPG